MIKSYDDRVTNQYVFFSLVKDPLGLVLHEDHCHHRLDGTLMYTRGDQDGMVSFLLSWLLEFEDLPPTRILSSSHRIFSVYDKYSILFRVFVL